jgi:hypothetical protein
LTAPANLKLFLKLVFCNSGPWRSEGGTGRGRATRPPLLLPL